MGRYRKSVIEERARESQRLHKVLEDAGVKLSSVASSVLTKSGRDMIDALIAGQRDSEVLAEMAKGRMRSKIPQLKDAMAGRFNEHHALLCRAMLARIDQADATVDTLTARIDELLDPYEAAVTLLVTIPGVARRSAQVILAEIGADMSRFPTAGHLASWAGMCPGNTDAAGDPVTLDVHMRAHAHVEDNIRRLKDSGASRFPFVDIDANRTWLAVVCFADGLVRWFQQLCLTGALALAEPKTLRWGLWHTPARIVRRARRRVVRILDGWPSTAPLLDAYGRIAALT